MIFLLVHETHVRQNPIQSSWNACLSILNHSTFIYVLHKPFSLFYYYLSPLRLDPWCDCNKSIDWDTSSNDSSLNLRKIMGPVSAASLNWITWAIDGVPSSRTHKLLDWIYVVVAIDALHTNKKQRVVIDWTKQIGPTTIWDIYKMN